MTVLREWLRARFGQRARSVPRHEHRNHVHMAVYGMSKS